MEQAQLSLVVVILNYRTPQLVIDCLHSLDGQLMPSETVIIVDNYSADGSVETLRQAIVEEGWGKWVRLIEAADNRGFSAGNNLGILAVNAETYFLLNSDTLVREGAMQELRSALASHPEVDLFAPRLEWPDGTPQISSFRDPSPLSELDRAAATGPISKILRPWAVSPPLPSQPCSFEWASFAAILIRRRVFAQIGLMDEGYFLYFEDIDFCHRARKAGFSSLYWPDAHVVHLRGGSGPVKSSQKSKGRLPSYFYASRSRYFAKVYGRLGLFLANVLWCLGRGISLLREFLGRKNSHLCEKEGIDIWHNLWCPVAPPESWRGTFPPST